MANIDKDGYIKTQDANGNIVTVYPYTKAGNVDGLDVFGASGSNHSTGLVPDPGTTAGSTKYLREDGTWAEPAGGGGGAVDTVYIGSTEYAPDSNGKVTLPAYPTSLPASDVYSWAKSSSKPSYSASEVGAVPTSRTINGYNLSANRTLTYSDVGAASEWTKTNVGFAASNYGVYQYTGLSITVPKYQVFMITAVDLFSNASPEGILIATSSSSLSGSVLIGKSESDSSSANSHYARSVVAITPKLDNQKTYYIWVKRGNTGTNQVRLFTQRIE